MQNTILVITPQATFGELIRQTLEETGRYRVEVAYQAADGLARCRKPVAYRLVVVDGDLTGPLDRVIADLRAAQPEARLALIPPEHSPDPEAIHSLPVDGALSKPFYLPSLAATIDRLISGEAAGNAAGAALTDRALEGVWPESAEACRAELERQMEASGALGAVLIVNGAVHAAAGCAGDEWAAELLDALSRRPDQPGDAELLLYRKSPDGAGQVLVYAVDRRAAATLALVYPPDVPYSQARSRMRQLKQNEELTTDAHR